jgi:zinc protease
MIKTKIYDNGMALIVNTDKKSKYTAFNMYFKVGSEDEQEKEFGVAHFLEHLFFKSTKNMRTSEIAKYLEI